MPQSGDTRVDKYLWAVRIFKTRTQALEACKKGRVLVNGLSAKPSKSISKEDRLEVKKPPVNYSYVIRDIPKSRLSAKLVPDFLIDLTPAEELQKLQMADDFFIKRDRGTGRPTKKERRIIDKLKEE